MPPGGFVTGPASSTIGDIAVFSNTSGNAITDTGVNVSDFLLAINNLSDLNNVTIARINLGLTNAAIAITTQFAVLIGDVANGIANVGPGLTNQVLNGNTGSAPTWGSVPSGALPGSGQITLANGANITVTGSPVSLGGTATIALVASPSVTNLTVAGQVLGDNGSAANPTYSFSSATNYGIYTDGTKIIAITNGFVAFSGDSNNFTISGNTFQGGTLILQGALCYHYFAPAGGSFPYTALQTDQYLAIDTTSARTVNLPNAPTQGSKVFIIKDKTGTAGTNNITVTTPGGTTTFDGATSFVINVNFGSFTFIYDAVSNYEVS